MKTVPQIRIFLASPGDVNEERAVALEVLDMLEYDPLFKRSGAGGVSIHAVAWDKPGGDTPMRATKTPQTAIKDGLPRPAECDIVLVFFWGRMGTPLPLPEYQKDDGSPFLSGTEWEYTDAVTAERAKGTPITLIYRRTEKPAISIDDDRAIEQYRKVRAFFEQFRDPATGAFVGGVNEYATPEELRVKLLTHLRQIIDGIVQNTAPAAALPRVEPKPLWTGSPFPGLRAFTEADAPIFFGRGQETSELVKRVEASRFTAVVAASGSGKSSLVAAGLIPRLKANAIVSGETGSKDWRYVRFTPGQDASPFAALFAALCETFPEHAVSPFLIEQEKDGFITSITQTPAALVSICDALLREAKAPAWAEILFFVDQFEELFTLVRDADRAPFVALLEAIHASRLLRCVVTMRSDFYANCLDLPALAALLKEATYPLAVPTAGALIEMIKRPAERAGLTWHDGLPERIQAETGSDAGSLALMAYALDELYQTSHADKQLTFAAYQAIGGVDGAIGKRAESLFSKPGKDSGYLLQGIFRELVAVDERGTATKQPASLSQFNKSELALIRALADARLLVTRRETVEVAHEAIFHKWEWLRNWIVEAQEDLIVLRQVRAAAEDWMRKGQPEFLRYPTERLRVVYAMIDRRKPPISEALRLFIEPETDRLLHELENLPMTAEMHGRRRDIGDRLAVITDVRPGVGVNHDGTPDMFWIPTALQEHVQIQGKILAAAPLYVSKYLVTYPQFQTFVEAINGFHNMKWWAEFPDEYVRHELSPQRTQTSNSPRDSVSWYQSIAFARWLDYMYQAKGYYEKLPPIGVLDKTSDMSPVLHEVENTLMQIGSVLTDSNVDIQGMLDTIRTHDFRGSSADDVLTECLKGPLFSETEFHMHDVELGQDSYKYFINYKGHLCVETYSVTDVMTNKLRVSQRRKLELLGVRMLRIPNHFVLNDIGNVLKLIHLLCANPALSVHRITQGLPLKSKYWEIRLPTEWEWQLIASNGAEMREYPWGTWSRGNTNTDDAGLGRTTAVGCYPNGAAGCGVLDMSGNLSEWCLNDFDDIRNIKGFENGKPKVRKGGSFNDHYRTAACKDRSFDYPFVRHNSCGFRLVIAPRNEKG